MITVRLLGLHKPGYYPAIGESADAQTAEGGSGLQDSRRKDVPTVADRLYSRNVDSPDPVPMAQEKMPDVLRALLAADEDGPVMVTTWAAVCEYIDSEGSANVAAWQSDDPPWRVGGLLTVAQDLLDTSSLHEYDDEYDEEDD